MNSNEDAERRAWSWISENYPSDEYECQDNHRIALKGNEEQERAYQLQVEEGCCGSVDTEYTDAETGLVFFVGFNYGH
jgi:hypothetical protein